MAGTDGCEVTTGTRQGGVPIWVALVTAAAVCLVAYAVLRVPAWRAALLALAPHRVDTAEVRLRALLAPRSVALAGVAALAAVVASLLVPSARSALARRLPAGNSLTLLCCCVHALVAAAVMINLLYYFPRQFGQPLWAVSSDTVYNHILPQAWPDVKALRQAVGEEARIAFRPPPQNKFFLPALAYPIQFYDVWPSNEEDWRSDADFMRRVRDLRLTHTLRYEPLDRVHPLHLRVLD
jgi:hypothetical protein